MICAAVPSTKPKNNDNGRILPNNRSMKKMIGLLLIACVTALPAMGAQSGGFPQKGEMGAGIMLGTIDSITGKYWLNNRAAVDFGVGMVGSPWITLYADYLWHIPKAFGTGSQFGRETSVYFGGGAGLGFWNDDHSCGHWSCSDVHHSGTGLFARGIAGFEWYAMPTRFGLFFELGPTLMVVPNAWGTFDVAFGARYYF